MTSVYVTRKRYEELKDNLDKLNAEKQQVALEIAEAAGQGDLRENAAYTYAKERQSNVLSQIRDIQSKLNSAKILDTLKIDKSHVRIGARVTLEEFGTRREMKYALVGSDESDPVKNEISVDTPLAKAMLGKALGESFTVVLPKATKTFKIKKLEYK